MSDSGVIRQEVQHPMYLTKIISFIPMLYINTCSPSRDVTCLEAGLELLGVGQGETTWQPAKHAGKTKGGQKVTGCTDQRGGSTRVQATVCTLGEPEVGVLRESGRIDKDREGRV